MKIRYTPEAVHDLGRLRAFIEIKSPVAAQRVAKELLLGIDKLKVFPKIGVQVLRAPQPELVRDLLPPSLGKPTHCVRGFPVW